MGRPPFNDKLCIKKGPWTPEEDITLVSYIQEHGPGNWRCVPTNTGLMRCSKSCRLRWTNYLRPGIKRGNFTPQEEQKIIHLQTLLGNKWAAIASHLPQRTDNDVKNFWNIHLKKKILRTNMESTGNNCRIELTDSICPVNNIQFPLLGQESTPTPAPTIATSNCPSSMYVLSTENISQLLKSWKRTPQNTKSSSSSSCTTDYNDINKNTHDDNKGRHNDYSHLESILPFNHNLEEDFGTRWNAAELEMEIDGVFC